jgi:hypothetical protein
MVDLYLQHLSYATATHDGLLENLTHLNETCMKYIPGETRYYYHPNLYSVPIQESDFSQVVFGEISMRDQNAVNTFVKNIMGFQTLETAYETLEEWGAANPNDYHAFWIYPIDPWLDDEHHVFNLPAFEALRDRFLHDLDGRSIWVRRDLLFSRVVLCPETEDQLKNLPTKEIGQIFDRLKTLDSYLNKTQKFSETGLKAQTNLRFSRESESTRNDRKLMGMRQFKKPDGSTGTFELHIKTGEFRIHFLPEEDFVYIGYIGSHLPTSSS